MLADSACLTESGNTVSITTAPIASNAGQIAQRGAKRPSGKRKISKSNSTTDAEVRISPGRCKAGKLRVTVRTSSGKKVVPRKRKASDTMIPIQVLEMRQKSSRARPPKMTNR